MHLKPINIVLLSIVFLFGANGTAFSLPCSQGDVSGSTSCQDGSANNDFVSSPLQVNTESFFGFTDWEYLSKFDEPDSLDEPFSVNWVVEPSSGSWSDDSGTWSFSNTVWNNFEDVMIVVKAGPIFSGYLLDSVAQPESGTWATGDKDLSHLTLYARGESAPVPEPTTLLLFGTGLLGIAAYKRKR